MSAWDSFKHRLKVRYRQWTGQDLHYRPTYRGPVARLGTDYGGWWVCPDLLGPDSIIYSIGVGTDVSFDLALIEAFGCAVHAFDPTPRSMAWVERQRLPAGFHFHPWGVAAASGHIELAAPAHPDHASFSIARSSGPTVRVPVLTVGDMMTRLGHQHLDVLKMDVEGMEYEVIAQLLAAQTPVRQLLVEFHHNIYPTVPMQRTQDAIAALLAAGYQLFKVSATNNEYHFVRR